MPAARLAGTSPSKMAIDRVDGASEIAKRPGIDSCRKPSRQNMRRTDRRRGLLARLDRLPTIPPDGSQRLCTTGLGDTRHASPSTVIVSAHQETRNRLKAKTTTRARPSRWADERAPTASRWCSRAFGGDRDNGDSLDYCGLCGRYSQLGGPTVEVAHRDPPASAPSCPTERPIGSCHRCYRPSVGPQHVWQIDPQKELEAMKRALLAVVVATIVGSSTGCCLIDRLLHCGGHCGPPMSCGPGFCDDGCGGCADCRPGCADCAAAGGPCGRCRTVGTPQGGPGLFPNGSPRSASRLPVLHHARAKGLLGAKPPVAGSVAGDDTQPARDGTHHPSPNSRFKSSGPAGSELRRARFFLRFVD